VTHRIRFDPIKVADQGRTVEKKREFAGENRDISPKWGRFKSQRPHYNKPRMGYAQALSFCIRVRIFYLNSSSKMLLLHMRPN